MSKVQMLHDPLHEPRRFADKARGLILAKASEVGSPRLLLIDDDPLLRRAMSRMLDTAFVVTVAGSVGEALALMDREPFDVLLCDLHLDGLSGLDLYVRLSKSGSPLAKRLVITTGADTTDPSLDHLRTNGITILKKPVDHDATITLLRRVALRP